MLFSQCSKGMLKEVLCFKIVKILIVLIANVGVQLQKRWFLDVYYDLADWH